MSTSPGLRLLRHYHSVLLDSILFRKLWHLLDSHSLERRTKMSDLTKGKGGVDAGLVWCVSEAPIQVKGLGLAWLCQPDRRAVEKQNASLSNPTGLSVS